VCLELPELRFTLFISRAHQSYKLYSNKLFIVVVHIMEGILLAEKQGHICTLSLNRPNNENRLTHETFLRLKEAVNSANKDSDVRVIILRGSGEEMFSRGIDLGEEVKRGARPEDLRKQVNQFRDDIEAAMESMIYGRCPTIAMIYGDCLAGGTAVAVACDFRICSDISRFSLWTVLVGQTFQWQGIQRMLDLIGPANTKEILLAGGLTSAVRAKEMGLVNFLVPAKDVFNTTLAFAQEIAEKAPLAVSGTKEIISRLYKTKNNPTDADKADFQAIMDRCSNSEDAKEGPRAALEGRRPNFSGR
jgi:enoyl-CoA hydratase